MKYLTCIILFLLGIDFKKWLTRIVAVILGTVFILALIALVISLLQWGDECERRTIFILAEHLFLVGDVNVSITFFALVILQTSAFILVFVPIWKRMWFRVSIAIALISYPIVFWVLMKIHESMRS